MGTCVGATDDTAATATADKCLTCAAAEGEGESTLAGLGETCSATTEDSGCIDGHRCATYTAVEEDTTADPVVQAVEAGERCAAEADCDLDGVTCGAMQLGASLVAAVAIVNLM